MSEEHAHCALKYFLDGTAADHYIAVNNSSTADKGDVTSWPEAVHYPLHSYATHDAIREATLKLTSIRQGSTETEEGYSARLNNAAIRCGNVHSMDKKKTIFVDGLQTATKALVWRYREDHPRATYLELVQFASVQGKTHRARTGVTPAPKKADQAARAHTPKQKGSFANPLLKREQPALYADQSDASYDLFERRSTNTVVDNVHLIGELPSTYQGGLISDATSELSSTLPTSDAEIDPALYMTPRSRPRLLDLRWYGLNVLTSTKASVVIDRDGRSPETSNIARKPSKRPALFVMRATPATTTLLLTVVFHLSICGRSCVITRRLPRLKKLASLRPASTARVHNSLRMDG